MSHQPSLECPNCGRILVQGEEYCYFCELNVGKMMKSHSQSRHHGHSERKTRKK